MYGLIDKRNDTESQMIGRKLKDAIKWGKCTQSIKKIITLSDDGLHSYFVHPGEEYDDQLKEQQENTC